MRKINIEKIQDFAINKGGLLLSTEYKKAKDKLLWQCSCGYIWERSWDGITTKESWCPKCSGRVIPSMADLQDLATSKGGLLLSTEYKTTKNKLLWECKNKHQFLLDWSHIASQNAWCQKCAGKAKPSLKEIQDFAINNGGLLLSTEYKKYNNYLLWQCENGHTWEASWGSLKYSHTWCPKCAGTAKPLLEEIQQFAINKNGLLLSVEYKNNHSNLLWQCDKKHQWEARWSDINCGNNWCPQCSLLKNEKACKEIIERLLSIRFKKIRFYYNNDNKVYHEFDGYNEELKVAFEYNGIQHYEHVPYFHRGTRTVKEQQKRDKKKEQYCIDNNIKLIVIPYTENKKLEQFILAKLIEHKLLKNETSLGWRSKEDMGE